MVALSYEDAERAGIYVRDSDFTQRVSTANGIARVAPVTLDRVSIGDITVRNVPAAVTRAGQASRPRCSACRFLGRLQRFDMRSRRPGAAGIASSRSGRRPCVHTAECHRIELCAAPWRLHLPIVSSRLRQGVPSMLPKPRADLKPNTADFERLPLVKPTGFREYDARWLFPEEINLMGLKAVGLGHGHAVRASAACQKRFVVGHDYRSYSASVKQALIDGPAGRRLRGARHRPGPVADGLLRPVRARRRRRGHGHRQPQRQRLDRHQDGLRSARSPSAPTR